MKTKAIILSIILCIATVISASAEKRPPHGPGDPKTIENETRWLVKKLKLSGDTINTFTEMYTRYRNDLNDLFEKNKPAPLRHDKNGKIIQPSDQEADRNIRNGFTLARKIIDLRENYYNEFLTILPPAKIDQMYRAEKRLQDRKRHEMESRHNKRNKRKNK